MQTQQNPPLPQQDAIIQVRNVRKRFGKEEATIHDLTFEVQRGTIFCLLGPSGSGKSTTMRMLTGVYPQTEGMLRVMGVEPKHFGKRIRARIGYMPQQFVLFPELTTLENINFVASVYGMSWFGRGRKVRAALEFVDLWPARHRLASQLSGGMQRRLELASTLVHQPEVLFVDEPTAGIDPVLRAKFWEQFKELRDAGRTLFVTTQYVTEADYCDTVAILNHGRLLALGTPEEVRRQAQGGDIINLKLEEVTGQALRILRSIPEMRRVQIMSNEDVRLTVADSSTTLQEIIHAFQQNNIPIQSIEPYRPNFEEIFVQLLEADTPTEISEEKVHEKKGKQPNDSPVLKGVALPKNVQQMSAEDFLQTVPAEAPRSAPPPNDPAPLDPDSTVAFPAFPADGGHPAQQAAAQSGEQSTQPLQAQPYTPNQPQEGRR